MPELPGQCFSSTSRPTGRSASRDCNAWRSTPIIARSIADLVAAVHAAGYKLLCYTPNDPAQAAELARWGVDGIITDAVDVIRPA